MIRLTTSWWSAGGTWTVRPCEAIRSVKNERSIAKVVPMKPTSFSPAALQASATTSARCSTGIDTAASTWSKTRWKVVVHSSRKSAPARSTPCAASTRTRATPSQSSFSCSEVTSAKSTEAMIVRAEARLPSRFSTPVLRSS